MTSIRHYLVAQSTVRVLANLLGKRLLPASKQVVVVAPNKHDARMLDDQLWTFAETSFIPHCLAADKGAQDTPVIITDLDSAGKAPVRDVLVAVDGAWPETCASFEDFVLITKKGDGNIADLEQKLDEMQTRGHQCKVIDLVKK